MDIALGILIHRRKILVARRLKQQHLGGFWEFPGGKVEPGELPLEAVTREFKEECDLDVELIEAWPSFAWQYPDVHLTFHPFVLRWESGEATGKLGQELKWVGKHEIQSLVFPDANHQLLKRIDSEFNLICDRAEFC